MSGGKRKAGLLVAVLVVLSGFQALTIYGSQ